MGIGEFVLDPGLHHFGRVRRDRRRRLVVEIDHAARWRDAIRCHSARNASTSASLVHGPKLILRKLEAMAGSTCITFKTRLSFIAPLEQALPADTAMPARSNCTSNPLL